MQTTAAEQVYAHLLSRILHNELKPGDWVERKQLAEGMKTSLMPIAEAVQRLTLEGFLVSVPRRGTQVRVPGAEDVRGQILVREALECQAARLYCGAPVQAARSRLQRLAKTADAPSGKSTAWEAELAFHSALVELADCAALLENYMRVMNLVLFQQSALLTPYSLNRGDSHVQLIEDLGRLDADEAEARMRKHIRTGKEQILQPTQRAKKN